MSRTWFSVAAIFLSIAGLLIPPLAFVAIGMGLLAMRQPSPGDRWRGKFAVALSSTGLFVLGGMLLRSREQTSGELECRVGLEALNLAQDAHRKTRGRYASSADELGLPIAPQYFLAASGEHKAALQKLKVGREGQCPSCTVTMACLDGAQTWWTITSGGKPIAHAAP